MSEERLREEIFDKRISSLEADLEKVTNKYRMKAMEAEMFKREADRLERIVLKVATTKKEYLDE